MRGSNGGLAAVRADQFCDLRGAAAFERQNPQSLKIPDCHSLFFTEIARRARKIAHSASTWMR